MTIDLNCNNKAHWASPDSRTAPVQKDTTASSSSSSSTSSSSSGSRFPLLNPCEHPSDKLRSILFEKGYIDPFGNLTPYLLDTVPDMQISSFVESRVAEFYKKERIICFTTADHQHITIKYTLEEFLGCLSACAGFSNRVEIVGGLVWILLGEESVVEYLTLLNIDNPKDYITQELFRSLTGAANDQDMRFYKLAAIRETLESLKVLSINFLANKLNLDPNSIKLENAYDIVLNSAFHKLAHHHSEPLQYLTWSPKDEDGTEVCIISRIPREHLFIHDALAINFADLLKATAKRVELKSDLSSTHHAFICRILGLLDADQIETIDHFGWPMYISHLSRGKICLKSDVEKQLTNNFIQLLDNKNKPIPPLNDLLIKVFRNHHAEPGQKNPQSLMDSLPLYVLNALGVAIKHLSKEKFDSLKKLLVGSIYLKSVDQ